MPAEERDYDMAYDYYSNAVTHGLIQAAIALNELAIARALEDGDFKEAKKRLEARKKVWNDAPVGKST